MNTKIDIFRVFYYVLCMYALYTYALCFMLYALCFMLCVTIRHLYF